MRQEERPRLVAAPDFAFLSHLFVNSPANAEAAQLYRDSMKEYVRRVKQTVEASWVEGGEGEEEDDEDEDEEEGRDGEPMESTTTDRA